MKKLYEKSELSFAIMWIVIYCAAESLAYPLSERIGIESSAAAIINVILTAFLFIWVWKNGWMKRYGLCKASLPAKKFLWYIPLAVIVSHNLWNGAVLNRPVADTICYVVNMLCVGFLEEMLIRGFLFRAIAKDGVKSAIVISSVSFGLGHLLNLVNGSGMGIGDNLYQVVYAIAIGFLFAILLVRGGSLWPCVAAHSGINVASAFANAAGLHSWRYALLCAVEFILIVVYTLILLKTLPAREDVRRE